MHKAKPAAVDSQACKGGHEKPSQYLKMSQHHILNACVGVGVDVGVCVYSLACFSPSIRITNINSH